jgi:hypothetical protein
MSREDVELVGRWSAFMPDLRAAHPGDDRALLDRAFRDFLDEQSASKA